MRVAIIPARSGSKRIPGKNIRMFHGKPIIAYSIEVALASTLFDYVFVSTDSDEIGRVAASHGASVWERDPALADDKTGTQEVAAEFLQGLNADEACVIYATAPLLSVQSLLEGHAALCLPHTQFSFAVGAKPVLHDAGQFYFGRAAAFAHIPLWDRWSRMVQVPPERDCDINTEEDWLRAEQMFNNLRSGA
jgi:pseudaminic acid cytidylyltransferase